MNIGMLLKHTTHLLFQWNRQHCCVALSDVHWRAVHSVWSTADSKFWGSKYFKSIFLALQLELWFYNHRKPGSGTCTSRPWPEVVTFGASQVVHALARFWLGTVLWVGLRALVGVGACKVFFLSIWLVWTCPGLGPQGFRRRRAAGPGDHMHITHFSSITQTPYIITHNPSIIGVNSKIIPIMREHPGRPRNYEITHITNYARAPG